MKNLIRIVGILTMVVILVNTAQAESMWREINTEVEESGLDFAVHLSIGSGVSYYMAEELEINREVSAVTPLLIGVVKELTDKNFDPVDLITWGASGLIGAYLIPGLFVTGDEDEMMVGYSFDF